MIPLISMAFMTGLLGSAHCIGMCGGLVSALSLTADGRNNGVLFHILYNIGRTITYSFIGFLVGWLGSTMVMKSSLQELTRLLLIGSDLFIILIGIGSAGLFAKLNFKLMKVNGPLRPISRCAEKLRTLPPALSSLPLGLLFGFLPCGLLYAMALTAAQSADSLTGALTMAAFGVGTIPALLLVGSAARWFSSKQNWMLKAAGGIVALMGCYNLVTHIGILS